MTRRIMATTMIASVLLAGSMGIGTAGATGAQGQVYFGANNQMQIGSRGYTPLPRPPFPGEWGSSRSGASPDLSMVNR